jgi:hypothetical protein
MFVVNAKTPSLPMLVNRAFFFIRPYSCRYLGTSNAYAIRAKRQKKMEEMDKLFQIRDLHFDNEYFARPLGANCVMGVTVEQPIASLVRRSAAF